MRKHLKTRQEEALALLADGSVWTMARLRERGVTIHTMRRLLAAGSVNCPALGVYQIPNAGEDAFAEWAQVAAREPGCVFVLTSAAIYHGITQEMPAAIQIGIPMHRGHPPRMGGDFVTPVEAIRWRKPRDLEVGIETHRVNGVDLRITSQERTVIDLWRYSTLNEALPGRFSRIYPETFYDALGKYLTPGVGNADVAALGRMAEALGVKNPIRSLIEFAASSAPQP